MWEINSNPGTIKMYIPQGVEKIEINVGKCYRTTLNTNKRCFWDTLRQLWFREEEFSALTVASTMLSNPTLFPDDVALRLITRAGTLAVDNEMRAQSATIIGVSRRRIFLRTLAMCELRLRENRMSLARRIRERRSIVAKWSSVLPTSNLQ